jgi:hypothetical protein
VNGVYLLDVSGMVLVGDGLDGRYEIEIDGDEYLLI